MSDQIAVHAQGDVDLVDVLRAAAVVVLGEIGGADRIADVPSYMLPNYAIAMARVRR